MQEDDALTDVGRAICEALEVVRHPEQVCGARDGARIGHHKDQELAEHLVVELVDLVVALGDGTCGFDVPADKGVDLAHQQLAADLGHARHVDQRLQQRLVGQPLCQHGDPLGVIRHALEFRGNGRHGKDQAQIARHGLLAGDQREARFFNLPLRLVDLLVACDEFLREFFVVLGQRLDRLLLQLVHHRRQVYELLFDLSQLQIEVLTCHVGAPSRTSLGHRAIIASFGRGVKSC